MLRERERDSLVPGAQLEMGLRPILRISSHLVCSRAHCWAEFFSLSVQVSLSLFFFKSGFFQVEIILSTWPDLAELLSFFLNSVINLPTLQAQARALASCIDTEVSIKMV